MANEDPDFHNGHRARLRQKLLDGQITNYELVELIISFAIPRRDVRPLARGLIAKFGGIHQIINAPVEKLMEYPGVGKSTAVLLKSINAIVFAEYKNRIQTEPVFFDDKILYNYCRTLVAGKTKEEAYVLYMDASMRLLAQDLHTIGTSDGAQLYGHDIFKRAVALDARNVLLLHNHPTPNTAFSQDDIVATTQIENLLSAGGIYLYDHLVVSGDLVYSARNLHLLNKSVTSHTDDNSRTFPGTKA